MIKKLSLLLIVAVFGLSMAGCSKDAEVAAFITEFDTATNEIVQKIDANPSAAGADEALKIFDSKKDALKSKLDSIKGARSFQVREESITKLIESYTKNYLAIKSLQVKHVMKEDLVFKAKLRKLEESYSSTFQLE